MEQRIKAIGPPDQIFDVYLFGEAARKAAANSTPHMVRVQAHGAIGALEQGVEKLARIAGATGVSKAGPTWYERTHGDVPMGRYTFHYRGEAVSALVLAQQVGRSHRNFYGRIIGTPAKDGGTGLVPIQRDDGSAKMVQTDVRDLLTRIPNPDGVRVYVDYDADDMYPAIIECEDGE